MKQSTKFKVTSSRLIRFGTRLKVKLVSSSRFTSTRIYFLRAQSTNRVLAPTRSIFLHIFPFLYSILDLPHLAQEEDAAPRCIIERKREKSSEFIIASLLATLNFIMNDNVVEKKSGDITDQDDERTSVLMP